MKIKNRKGNVFLILHNIRSVHNVGSIFRTAEAIGVSKMYTTGYTPAPVDRFGKVRSDIAKTALGAENIVQWEQAPDIKILIEKLRKDGTKVIAVEQSKKSIDYKNFKLEGSAAFIFGSETEGIEEDVLEMCDSTIEISMYGEKESLNVSVSAGIVLFSIFDR